MGLQGRWLRGSDRGEFYALLLLFAVFFGRPIQAGDPWKNKSPAEWTSQDATKLLTKSPWVQEVSAQSLTVTEVVEERSGPPTVSKRVTTRDPVTGKTEVIYIMVPVPPRKYRRPKLLTYSVVWLSARAVQHALVTLEGAGPVMLRWWYGPREALRVSDPSPDYVLLLSGPNTRRLADLSEAEMADSVYLEYGKNHQSIPVRRIQYFAGIEAALLYFPRALDASVRKVRLHFDLTDVVVDKDIKLDKMTLGGSADF